jgi:DNA-binding winged helix-turn-helix (wHTH) protein
MRNLPTDESRALSKEEIREVVFGTRSEQQEQITQALKHLRKAGMIEPLIDDGYIKTGEYDGE